MGGIKMKKKKVFWKLFLLSVLVIFGGCVQGGKILLSDKPTTKSTVNIVFPKEYDETYQELVINDNRPNFTATELNLSEGVWQTFSNLDNLNRVGVANALIGKESFPIEERSPRLTIKPTGWQQKKLPGGQWLYNRCHLIGFQLTGENDNPKNLMTGTRSFNTPHMLNYENQIMDYIRLTGNHVRYRVTPDFRENELVARGIQLEAKSVEDDDFSFNVYIFNVQDGYTIDYATGSATKK
jgi:DNA-entry nuclease